MIELSEFVTPPILRGTEREQLTQLRDYLFQLHRQLGAAVTAVEDGSFSVAGTEKIASAAAKISDADKATKDSLSRQVATLKSLIIKNADLVEAQIEGINGTLTNSYLAKSDFGTYFNESIDEVDWDGTGLSQTIKTVESLSADMEGLDAELHGVHDAQDPDDNWNGLADNVGLLQEFMTESQATIKLGVIDNQVSPPKVGLCIGQDIVTTGTQTVGNKVLPIIDMRSAMTTLTPEKLSFYLNGREVAYFGNNGLVVTGSIVMGNWQISYSHGFAVKWIGA